MSAEPLAGVERLVVTIGAGSGMGADTAVPLAAQGFDAHIA